jgi:fatty-acyl-CoA synthase
MFPLPDITAKRALLAPDAIAFEEIATRRIVTYAELDRRSGEVAALLAARGIQPGDRVAILCRNRVAFFELLFGCAKRGAILVPLNWRMPAAELAPLVADAEPSLLFFGAEDAEVAAALGLNRVGLDGEYEAALAASTPGCWRAHWPADETWYLLYTSGTTGTPKGVIYTYGMALANHVNIGSAIDLRSTDTTVNFLPLFHTAGINLHTLPTLMTGGRVLVLPGFDEEALLTLLAERRLDTFFAVPSVYQALLDHPRFAALPLDAVRHWGCGGAPLPERVAQHLQALGLRVCNGMGMTETGPTAFLASPAEPGPGPARSASPSSSARSGSSTRTAATCRTGWRAICSSPAPPSRPAIGAIRRRRTRPSPPMAGSAPATSPAATPTASTSSPAPEGDVHLRGRERIPGRGRERAVHPPAIAEVAVVGAPDATWGEVGRAFIRPIPGVAALDYVELEAFCRARLAPYKVPKRFDIVTDFPRTAAGKIRKHASSRNPRPCGSLAMDDHGHPVRRRRHPHRQQRPSRLRLARDVPAFRGRPPARSHSHADRQGRRQPHSRSAPARSG